MKYIAFMEVLDAWVAANIINLFDKHFAKQMFNIESNPDEIYLVLCAFCSKNLSQQETCLLLKHLSNNYACVVDYPELQDLLDIEKLLNRMERYATIGGITDCNKPFVLEKDRLYLNRYYIYELELSARLKSLAIKQDYTRVQAIKNSLDILFPNNNQVDWQKIAAINSIISQLSIITGGPGTGKTSTVTKILCLLIELNPNLVIRLAAPTGKAANRLSESIRTSKAALIEQHHSLRNNIELIDEEASTIHRLLGISSHRDQLKYHKDNILPVDVLLIDESSMIDLNIMHKLFAALPANTKLILIGDPNQLASVEAGCVMFDICSQSINSQSTSFNAAKLQLFSELCNQDLAKEITVSDHPMQNSVCSLKYSYRFGRDSGIGNIATAINSSDSVAVTDILSKDYSDLVWLDEANLDLFLNTCCKYYEDYLQLISTANIEAILASFNNFRILSPTQKGYLGVDFINEQIESRLTARGLIDANIKDFYIGRPILICENDYNLKLFNGDVGLILQTKQDFKPMAYFQTKDSIKPFLPAQLPRHITCYAMTIHKSQGSEFDSVATILPSKNINKNLLKRELIYTAITRSKKKHIFLSSLQAITNSVVTPTVRASGLQDKLY